MKTKLFIDDERDPAITVDNQAWRTQAGMAYGVPLADLDWIIVRTVEEAIAYIGAHCFPDLISFDHDLGEGQQTGMDLAKAIVEMDLDTPCIPANFRFEVHSANPVGRLNIQSLLDNYLEFRLTDKPAL